MEINIYEFIEDMERNIANLYGRLKSLNNFEQSLSVFDFMQAHSNGHGDQIALLKNKHIKPKIDNSFFLKVHNDIKNSCFEEIRQTHHSEDAMEILARTEELVGKMYELLSGHYRKLGDYYNSIADDIGHMAEEEFNHRDMMLKEKEKYSRLS